MGDAQAPFSPGSRFLLPGRALPEEVRDQATLCLDDPLLHAVLEAVDCYAMILNPQRQILAASPVLLAELTDAAHPVGFRMGEVLRCVHASEGPDGCGSSHACRRCGALLTLLATQGTGTATSGECLFVSQGRGGWSGREFSVRAMPLRVAGHGLTLLTLRDISAQKRLESLDRIFFHDLQNLLLGLVGWAECLPGAGEDEGSAATKVLHLAERLTEEVAGHRRLLLAERGELVPSLEETSPGALFRRVVSGLGCSVNDRVIWSTPGVEGVLRTDAAILGRVLTNMVLNALEALGSEGRVEAGFERRGGRPTFWVRNPGEMSPEVASRVFHRSFSTKASSGRGLGTYAMKLLGEGVLRGRVGFTSTGEGGTCFFIELPEED